MKLSKGEPPESTPSPRPVDPVGPVLEVTRVGDSIPAGRRRGSEADRFDTRLSSGSGDLTVTNGTIDSRAGDAPLSVGRFTES